MEDNKTIIEGLVVKYTESIDAADPTLADLIWSKSQESSFIHPKGHERGYDEIRQYIYIDLFGSLFSKRKLEAYDIVVHEYGDTAVVEFYWNFFATFATDNSPLETHGRETQVYIRNSLTKWQLAHVHYSGMPKSSEREGF